MKKILLFLIFTSFTLFSQTNGINYQAVIYSPTGQQLPGANNQKFPLSNKTICLLFSIIDSNNVTEYAEKNVITTDRYGVVNHLIGSGTQVGGYASNFNSILWNSTAKNLKVELDVLAICSDYTLLSNESFTSVPFAFYAANAGTPGPAGPAGPQGTTGAQGPQGILGATGPQGPIGVVGPTGPQGPQGIQGLTGPAGVTGPQGLIGANGLSAYQTWLNQGNTGTEAQFLLSLQGPQGPTGTFQSGSNPGDILFWNGNNWSLLPIGNQGNVLKVNTGLPSWQSYEVNSIGSIGILNCSSSIVLGNSILQSSNVYGVSVIVPYSGGNGGIHIGETITSTGVMGLTATLYPGNFVYGTGSLIYSITGTPSTSGTASFVLNIGGQNCTLNISVANNLAVQYPAGSVFCASGPTAIVDVTNPITGKTWMDRNLGASQVATSANDLAAYGDLYQWGRGSDGHQCRNSNITTTLSSTDQPNNNNFIASMTPPRDWRNPQNNSLWQGINGINNPCPSGYRIPTIIELEAEKSTWTSGDPFATPLKLPRAGRRMYNNVLWMDDAYYWSSTILNSLYSEYVFNSNGVNAMNFYYRAVGMSVRCIKDASVIIGTIGAINCSSVTNVGTLIQGTAASGVSSSVSYTGGNGGSHSGQIVTSTGVTGLTATLAAGTFANGNGTLEYTISGTPISSGTASFAINIGGQTCTLSISVANNLVGQYPVGSVFCASGPTAIVDVTNPVTGKTWMDRNLGASQAATSISDALAYGDLYQWGRGSDGHQCRNSGTTTVLSSTNQPNNANFIESNSTPFSWLIPQQLNLWQGVNGINNPCPIGYRLPTRTEFWNEKLSWVGMETDINFTSPLKLSYGGERWGVGVSNATTTGRYYTSTTRTYTSTSQVDSWTMKLVDNTAESVVEHRRGCSVRCIKD
jgi:uncharacterized protein (TIGR02145 family)